MGAVAAAVFGDARQLNLLLFLLKKDLQLLHLVKLTFYPVYLDSYRDTSLGLNFSVVNYYDGQGMMVPKSLGVTSGLELDGANVCTNTGTTTD